MQNQKTVLRSFAVGPETFTIPSVRLTPIPVPWHPLTRLTSTKVLFSREAQ
jgi:hypothetical protein